jgi:hypothetical protein
MSLEEKLQGWTGPSSATEQVMQERTERMIREAVTAHPGFKDCSLRVYAKGSYPNNTNVVTDSDVDVAVQCQDLLYWGEHTEGAHPTSKGYEGPWTPDKLRDELVEALKAKFPGQVDTSGSTAIRVNSSSARVEADVVPCFDYRYYFSQNSWRDGARTFRVNGKTLENYPDQHLEKGRAKNTATNGYFKKAVRILKRTENAMLQADVHREVPSYFVECLVYNCPNKVFLESSWTKTIREVIIHIWNGLEGDEPSTDSGNRWTEVNECKYLFADGQVWTRQDGRDFAKAAWNYLGYAK